MSNRQIETRMPPPLPEKIADWVRVLKQERTINDLVEDIHRVLVDESPEYRALLRAVRDSQAVEGSLAADNTEAARMIRERAKALNSEVEHEKLATISQSLNVVMRRYGMGRKQRRDTVGGEIVPPETNGNAE